MIKREEIHILCATDDAYVPYCGIMLTSLFENNKDVDVCVYVIFDKELSFTNKKRFVQLAGKYGQQIEFVKINNKQLSQFPTKGMDYWSIAMYYRIFAAELLPESVSKLLYLDCDILVTGSLSELFATDLTGKAVGSISDIFIYTDECQQRLGYAAEHGYFNSGVLLINLDYWREHDVCGQCMSFLSENYERLVANDQDVLNAVLHDQKINLPLTYNYQIQFLSRYFFNLQNDDLKKQVMESYLAPRIIHYAYKTKPWNVMYYKLPFVEDWQHYKRMSLWAHILPTLPKRKCINWLIKRLIMWPLGLMKYDSGFVK